MEKLVRVAIDAMGGDNAPGEIVKGAIDAVNERNNLKVFLVGKSQRIHEELSKYQFKSEQVEIIAKRMIMKDNIILEKIK